MPPPLPSGADGAGSASGAGVSNAATWPLSRIHLFGFSDGGTVALEAAAQSVGERRLGGAATVCASFLPEVLPLAMAAEGSHWPTDANSAPHSQSAAAAVSHLTAATSSAPCSQSAVAGGSHRLSDANSAHHSQSAAAAAAATRLPPDARAPTPVVLTCGGADRVVIPKP